MKLCPYIIWDGGELSQITCKITDYSTWNDSSVHWDRPKDCPFRNSTVDCQQHYDWDEWERRAHGMKRPRNHYDD